MSYSISEIRCPQNHRCPIIKICPANAIVQDGFGLPVIDETKCTNCGKCAKFCPTGAVQK